MLAWGLLLLSRSRSLRRVAMPDSVRRWLVRSTSQLNARPPLARAALIGLSTALLPCGWLYAFVVAAAGSASPLTGALIMLALWMGSLPALLGLGLTVQAILRRGRSALAWLNAVALIALGALGIAGRLDVPAMALDQVRSVLGAPAQPPRASHCGPVGPAEPATVHQPVSPEEPATVHDCAEPRR
jgi:uncharacterized protein